MDYLVSLITIQIKVLVLGCVFENTKKTQKKSILNIRIHIIFEPRSGSDKHLVEHLIWREEGGDKLVPMLKNQIR